MWIPLARSYKNTPSSAAQKISAAPLETHSDISTYSAKSREKYRRARSSVPGCSSRPDELISFIFSTLPPEYTKILPSFPLFFLPADFSPEKPGRFPPRQNNFKAITFFVFSAFAYSRERYPIPTRHSKILYPQSTSNSYGSVLVTIASSKTKIFKTGRSYFFFIFSSVCAVFFILARFWQKVKNCAMFSL